MGTCETFGCDTPAVQSITIAPGTCVKLCQECINEFAGPSVQATEIGFQALDAGDFITLDQLERSIQQADEGNTIPFDEVMADLELEGA